VKGEGIDFDADDLHGGNTDRIAQDKGMAHKHDDDKVNRNVAFMQKKLQQQMSRSKHKKGQDMENLIK